MKCKIINLPISNDFYKKNKNINNDNKIELNSTCFLKLVEIGSYFENINEIYLILEKFYLKNTDGIIKKTKLNFIIIKLQCI